jgi:hypothetical protein
MAVTEQGLSYDIIRLTVITHLEMFRISKDKLLSHLNIAKHVEEELLHNGGGWGSVWFIWIINIIDELNNLGLKPNNDYISVAPGKLLRYGEYHRGVFLMNGQNAIEVYSNYSLSLLHY